MSRTLVTCLVAFALAGCAAQPEQPSKWRLAGYAPGTAPVSSTLQARLGQDDAACRYELMVAQSQAQAPAIGSTGPYATQLDALGGAMLAGPGPDAYDLCMRARGWERAE